MDKFAADAAHIGLRLDVYAQGKLGLTRNAVQKLIDGGNILVSGAAAKSGYRLRAGDMVEIDLPPLTEAEILPQNLPLDIVYEDADIIVVEKPKGMVVHPAAGHNSGTLVNALLHHCDGSLSGINGVMRPGIVHRLDKDTSGLLVAAKNDAAHNGLAEQFAAHSIKREYLAVVHGGFKEDAGKIDAPIARHKINRKKMAVVQDGRRAVTHWRVTERLGKYTLIKCTLETGRTHQIRVHMAHIGRPVLGDAVYGSDKQPFGAGGQVLHAHLLGFVHPISRQYMEFASPLPDYFEWVLSKIGRVATSKQYSTKGFR
ncbi:MAG: RluA family pseudouridine synthase [Clostridiales bacterium]|nr:RluA family pseudouridine synthase [Clostridiales bacterium]